MPVDPFSFDQSSRPLRRAALIAARPLLSTLFGLDTLRQLYARLDGVGSGSFHERALRVLNVEVRCADEDLKRIPARGPVIVAANHPRGALDGLALTALVGRVRSDVRVLTNFLLERIPELCDSSFFVDPFNGPMAVARSRAGLRAAHLWLRQGGALIVFPAGEVAHKRDASGSPVDSDWKPTIGRLAGNTGATLVPAFIGGSNTAAFYAVGRVHPVLRTALLPRELLRQRGAIVTVLMGSPIEAKRPSCDEAGANDLTLRTREAVERLGHGYRPRAASMSTGELSQQEIAHMPAELLLVESGAYQVFCAPASIIPATLREIGRLRAVTYRAAGEGTDGEIDLDAFDDHYLHLFSWDRDQRRIVGAYRVGLADRIVAERGVEGLYTRTLFMYDSELITRLSPALELGRSFVRAEYQRQHQALLLLWKGIGRFVARNPQYRTLFGPVSISARYSDASHALLASFLQQNHLDGSLAEIVRPTRPFARRPAPAPSSPLSPRSVDEADRLVSSLEADGKGMPVLLRQYLKLNARLLGFNVDPGFGDVLDALMLVDLAAVDRSILSRYLGRDDAAAFLARHAAARPSRAA